MREVMLCEPSTVPALPPPLRGRVGGGGGSRGKWGRLIATAATPPPDPSPQGGGEKDSARVKLAVRRLVLAVASLLFVTSALADTIYVSNEQDNTISVIDSASLSVTATIE